MADTDPITQLADVIYGPLFLPSTIQRTTVLSSIRTSGIAVDDPDVSRFAQSIGDIMEMPFWTDIDGDSNVGSDDPDDIATPEQIVQGEDIARKIRRNIGFRAANLVAALLTEDPLSVISQLIAEYWVREEQKILGKILQGVFGAATMAGNKLDVATETLGDTNVFFSPDTASDAYALLGDRGTELTAIMMHSRVYWNLVAARALTVGRDPVTGQEFNEWEGKRVIVNDQLPRTAGSTSGYKYTSYLFGQGALAYAECVGAAGPKRPVEVYSQPQQGGGEGIETVWYRRHFVLHPRGVKFTSASVAGKSPTDAELATQSNWIRVYDPKNVRIVALVTNG
jgi:hypothetical protein